MRIAYVCADGGVPVFGQKGCSVHVQEIIRAFLSRGHEVSLLASRIDGLCPADMPSLRTFRLPRIAAQESEDFAEQVKALNKAVANELHRLGPIDMVYERYSLWSTAGMEFAQSKHMPGVLEVNAPLVMEQKQHRQLLHEQLALRCESEVFNSASLIVSVSKEVAGYVAAKVSTATTKVVTVPNGVNFRKFNNLSRKTKVSGGDVIIGFVGSLKPWHGVETLLEAAVLLRRRHPHLRLLIVGDGPQRQILTTRAEESGIGDSVDFVGAIAPGDVPGYLERMDIAVAPYPALENFYFSPLKVYEYMAAGLPVVVSEIGQLKELISDRTNGLFFKPGDVQSLADRVDELIRSPQLREHIGLTAQRQMLEGFTWEKCAQRILNAAFRDNMSEV